MTIAKKVIGGYAVILVLMSVAVVIGFYSISMMQDAYTGFIDVNERLVDGSNELRFELRDQVANYRGFLLYPDDRNIYLDDLYQDRRQFNEIVGRMRELAITEEGRKMLDDISGLQARHEQAQEKVVALVQQGRGAEALSLGISEVRPITEELIEKARSFREREMKLEAEGRTEITKKVNRLSLVQVSSFILAFVFALSMGFLITRSITRQLREGTAQLASSSAEILAVTAQVASGAAETATSVSEMTSTVEVKQTAHVASQKAKYVSETSQKTVQVAQAGTKSAEESIDAMNHIRSRHF